MTVISSILVLIGLGLIIYWFIKRKTIKQLVTSNEHISFFKHYIGWIALFLLLIGSLLTPQQNLSNQTTTNSSQAPTAKKKSVKSSYKNIKVGMTYNQMIKVAGKPDHDSYKDLEYVTYNDNNIYFTNGKVRGGNTKELMDQVKSSSESKKASSKSEDNHIKSRASYFGRKDVENLQKYDIYKSLRIDDGIMYTDTTDKPMLIRIDTDDGYTTVYEYDKNAENGIGKELYAGKTILQKQKPAVIIGN